MNAAALNPAATAATAPSGPRFRTWHLFTLLAVASMVVTWFYNSHVMTDEVYRHLLSANLDSGRVDDLIAGRAQSAVWVYVVLPAVLWVRLAFVALVLQFFMLLTLNDVPVKKLFAASAWAFIPLLYEQALRCMWLARLGVDGIDQDSLALRPVSIASLFMDAGQSGHALYSLANMVNAFELGWAVLMFLALRRTGRVSRVSAVMLVLGVWLLFTGFQWGLGLYLTRTA